MTMQDIINTLHAVAALRRWDIRTGAEDHAQARAAALAYLLEHYQRLQAGDWSVVPSVALGGLRTDTLTVTVRLAHGRLVVDYTIRRHSMPHETDDGWSPALRGGCWTENNLAVPLEAAPEKVRALAQQVLEHADVEALAREQAAAWWRGRMQATGFPRPTLETMATLAARAGRSLDVDALERAWNEAKNWR